MPISLGPGTRKRCRLRARGHPESYGASFHLSVQWHGRAHSRAPGGMPTGSMPRRPVLLEWTWAMETRARAVAKVPMAHPSRCKSESWPAGWIWA
eukprot:s3_g22.t1